MRTFLRRLTGRLNASYWFIPAMLTVGALLLSLVTIVLDRRIGAGWVEQAGWLHASRPEGARELLSTISTAMISVAGTIFAVTIAAVVYASGSYGPRLLTNFMTDRGNQWSLGVFIATYVYSLMVVRTVRTPEENGGFVGFVPEISLIVATGLALLCVGFLVYFLHHVPDSIRINNVIATIGRRALRQIEQRFPDPANGEAEAPGLPQATIPVRANCAGYVEVIDYQTLAEACEECGVRVRVALRPGDFVHTDTALFYVERPLPDDDADRLRRAFAIGNNRTADQDIEYSLDELVEIALRALSPGINDPFTAVTCLHWLGAATASLAKRDLARDPDGDRYGERGVHAPPDDFEHFLARGFGSVRNSAAASPIAAKIFLQALRSVGDGGLSGPRLELVKREAKQLLEQAETVLQGPALAEIMAAV